MGDGIRKKKSLPGEGMGRGGQGRQWPGEAAARGGRGVGPGSYPPGTGRLVAPLVPLFLVAPVVLYWKQHQRYCVIVSVPPTWPIFLLSAKFEGQFRRPRSRPSRYRKPSKIVSIDRKLSALSRDILGLVLTGAC